MGQITPHSKLAANFLVRGANEHISPYWLAESKINTENSNLQAHGSEYRIHMTYINGSNNASKLTAQFLVRGDK